MIKICEQKVEYLGQRDTYGLKSYSDNYLFTFFCVGGGGGGNPKMSETGYFYKMSLGRKNLICAFGP